MVRHVIAALFLVGALSASGAKRIASIKVNEIGQVEAESVALGDSSNIVNQVVQALVSSSNTVFAAAKRGDNSWNVAPFGLCFQYIKDEGNGALDPETGEYHFTVERYWFDPNAELGPDGFPQDWLMATVKDTTFNNKKATATWSLYLSHELFGVVRAQVGSFTLDFGGGVVASLNPLEGVVYSAELEMKMSERISDATNQLASVAFDGDYRSLSNIPQYEIRAVMKDGKLIYKLFPTTPQKE